MHRDNPGHWVALFGQRPSGIILHGSRSGNANLTRQQEYDGTRRYAMNSLVHDPVHGDYYTGWNATVGPAQYSVHFDARRYGWNAGADGRFRLGIELAQAVMAQDIPDSFIAAFVHYYRHEVVPVWGEYDLERPGVLVMHAETEQGRAIGKSDTFLPSDTRCEDMKRRIRSAA